MRTEYIRQSSAFLLPFSKFSVDSIFFSKPFKYSSLVFLDSTSHLFASLEKRSAFSIESLWIDWTILFKSKDSESKVTLSI